jgi:hypothetical protein
MHHPLYRLSVPAFHRGLGVLSTYLGKAEAYANEKGIDPKVLIDTRLAPDMLSLAGQVQRASDTSKGSISRLTGVAAPRFDDTESTIAELQQRIAGTLAFFDSVHPAAFEGSDLREVSLNFPTVKATFTGEDYLLKFALPNFYFHLATAHGILRQQGLGIGKTDYLGASAW